MPALQYGALFTNQRPHALPHPQRGALFNSHLGPLRSAAKGAETGDIPFKIHGIVAPMPSGDHPPIEVKYPGQLDPFKSDLIKC